MESTAKDAGVFDDARSKLSIFGSDEISDAELVAIALGKSGRAVSCAHNLLESVGGLAGLSKKSDAELERIPEVGKATAAKLVAIVELSRRLSRAHFPYGKPLREPSAAASFVRSKLRDKQQEHFALIGLDARQRVKAFRIVSIGSMAQVDVHPRELFRPCIREGLHSVILVHNHPSGDPEPSEADIELTKRMCEVGRLVGIPVLDHLIVTDTEHCSLAALGFVGG